ncbi:MAG: VOC family protein [Halioglobus sp.]
MNSNVFGAVRMGYLVVGSRKIGEWKRFLQEAIGLHLASESSSALAFRMDAHARRLIIESDPSEDVIAVGWQLDDDAVLQVILDRLKGRGVQIDYIRDGEAQARGVESLHRFVGPKGLVIELFVDPLLDDTPLDMPCSAFITGAAGMGHISLMSREPQRNIAFWQDLLDARVSDTIALARGKRTALDVYFLRLNQRHHSIAIAATRGLSIDMFKTRINHFNMEVATLDDLSAAYERCITTGCKLSRGVGQHPNDKELSFYVHTPSGFEFEIGWDALAVDETTWQEGITYRNMSTWGHEIPGTFSSELSFGHLVNAVRSLRGEEYLPW